MRVTVGTLISQWEAAASGSPDKLEVAAAAPSSVLEPHRLPDLASDSSSDSSDDEEMPSVQPLPEAHPSATAAAAPTSAAGQPQPQSGHISSQAAECAATAVLQEPLRRVSRPTPTAILLWMTGKCHWQAAPLFSRQDRQSLEMADCSSAGQSPAKPGAAQFFTARDDSGGALPQLPPDLARLMPSREGCGGADELPPNLMTRADLEEAVTRLRRQLQESHGSHDAIVRALQIKTWECENLTGVLRELTAERGRAAVGRVSLQEKCSALLSDVSRLSRVADLARRGQSDARTLAEAAIAARQEAEGEAAAAGSQASALETANARLKTANAGLKSRIAALERAGLRLHLGSSSGGSSPGGSSDSISSRWFGFGGGSGSRSGGSGMPIGGGCGGSAPLLADESTLSSSPLRELANWRVGESF